MSTPAISHDALLSARLSVRYAGKQPVLRNVEMDILPGEVLGLVGQSGSGKDPRHGLHGLAR